MIITIDGQVIDLSQNSEFKKVLADARKEASQVEKNKLYETMQQMKEQVSQLETANRDLLSKTNSLSDDFSASSTTTSQEQTVQQNQNAPQTVPNNGLSEQRIAEMIATGINSAISKVQDSIKPFVEQLNVLQTETTQQYLDRRINELGSTYSPFVDSGLIHGKNKSEIDASILKATKTLESLSGVTTMPPVNAPTTVTSNAPTTNDSKVTNTPVTTNSNTTPPPVAPIPAGGFNPGTSGPLDKVKNMTQEEYAKNRDTILNGIKQVQY